jgi:hypothetical protein
MSERPPSAFLPVGSGGPPPRQLGQYGRDLWDRVMAGYSIEDVGGIEMLCLACEAVDRAERCRAIIDRDGELIPGATGAMRAHPLIREELQNRAFAMRTIDRMGLNREALRPLGRPPGRGVGWQPPDYDD